VSWSGHQQHTDTGLAIVFAGPVSQLDMSDTAARFASLLAIQERYRMAGVVRTLEAENACASVEAMRYPLCCDCETPV
jgi:hypothetical protein